MAGVQKIYLLLHTMMLSSFQTSLFRINNVGVYMVRVILIVFLYSLSSISHAENWGIQCGELAAQAGRPDANSYPPLKAAASQNGRLYVYDSPSKYCRVKGYSITKGDVLTLTVNFSIEAWVYVRHGSEDEGWSGWVLRNSINEIIDMKNPAITFNGDAG